jgi:hypothetical protein
MFMDFGAVTVALATVGWLVVKAIQEVRKC